MDPFKIALVAVLSCFWDPHSESILDPNTGSIFDSNFGSILGSLGEQLEQEDDDTVLSDDIAHVRVSGTLVCFRELA